MDFKFKVKTPHRRPWSHLLKMYGYFLLGSLICMILGMGASLSTLSDIFAAAAITAALSLVGGIFVTASVRALFGLTQTGRLLQYAGFWLATLGALQLTDYFVPVYLLVGGTVAAFVIVLFSFAGAIIFGEVPVKGRGWLPVRRKSEATSGADLGVDAGSPGGVGIGMPVRALRKDGAKSAVPHSLPDTDADKAQPDDLSGDGDQSAGDHGAGNTSAGDQTAGDKSAGDKSGVGSGSGSKSTDGK